MKIYVSSKLTQYLTNIFKMRFLMKNMHSNAKMEFLRKRVWQQQYPIQLSLCGSPLDIIHSGRMGNTLIPDTEKHTLRPFLILAEFKNRYI